MKTIDGKAHTISEILKGKRYGIDYYHREMRVSRPACLAGQLFLLIGGFTDRRPPAILHHQRFVRVEVVTRMSVSGRRIGAECIGTYDR